MTTTTERDRRSSELEPTIAGTLAKLRRRIRRYVSIEGLALGVAWLGLAFWLSLAMDFVPVKFGYDELPYWARIAVLSVAAGVLLTIVFWLIVRRVRVAMPDRSMAVLLERRFRDYDDSLLTTVEMHEEPEHAAAFNQDMLRVTGDVATERTEQVKISQVFNPWPLARNLLLAAVFGASVVGFALAQEDVFQTWLSRFMLLNDATKWPRKNHVQVEGEYPRKIARGDDITVVVKADGNGFELPRGVRIEYQSEDGASGSENMTRVGDLVDGMQEYSYTFRGLLHTLDFQVVGGDYRVRGPQYQIEVVDSPTATLSLDIEYPAYTQRLPQRLEVRGTMDIPRGSRVKVVGVANKPLSEASVEVVYGEASKRPKLLSNIALASPESAEFSHVIENLDEPQDLRFSLTDLDGIRTRQPILLSLSAVSDEPPQVEVRLVDVGEFVTPQVKIPFEGKIVDDYGVQKVLIAFERTGEPVILFPFKEDPANRQEFIFHRAGKQPGRDEEALDFQLLAYEMRKKREAAEKDAEKAPKRDPGKEETPKADAKKADAKKDAAKKPAEDEDAKYQLKVGQTFTLKIIARDGCTLQRTNVEGYSTVFAFTVVTPEELRIKLAARELIQRTNFEKIRDEMLITRESLAAITFEVPATPPKAAPGKGKDTEKAAGKVAEKGREITAEDLRIEAFLRAQRAQQISAKNAIEVLEVAHQFDVIRGELINNRLYTEELNQRLKLGISDPLHRIGNEMFQELDKMLNDLIVKCDKEFSNADARDQAVALAAQQADRILTEMNSVLGKMLEFEAFNEAIKALRELLEEQDKVNKATKKMQLDSLLPK
jgi:hypothetical protein